VQNHQNHPGCYTQLLKNTAQERPKNSVDVLFGVFCLPIFPVQSLFVFFKVFAIIFFGVLWKRLVFFKFKIANI